MKSKLKMVGKSAAIAGSGALLGLAMTASPAGATTLHNGTTKASTAGWCAPMPIGTIGGLGAAALAGGAFVFRMRRRSASA